MKNQTINTIGSLLNMISIASFLGLGYLTKNTNKKIKADDTAANSNMIHRR